MDGITPSIYFSTPASTALLLLLEYASVYAVLMQVAGNLPPALRSQAMSRLVHMEPPASQLQPFVQNLLEVSAPGPPFHPAAALPSM